MTVSTNQSTEIEYPDVDGKPMAESDSAREYLSYAIKVLRIYFQDRSDVYVSGYLFIYYEQGNPRVVIAPDVFVVFGVSKGDAPRGLACSGSPFLQNLGRRRHARFCFGNHF